MENSHNFTLNEAAKETGRSKGTISKALNNGKLSYISKTKSGYQIEPSELFRVFPLKQDKSRIQVHLETQKETTKNIELEHQIELLKKDLEHIKEKADSLEDDRNHWRKQAKSVTLLLETDRKKTGIFDLFSKK
jgi:DNA-binding transcriptional regulator GbsR (MarR family)